MKPMSFRFSQALANGRADKHVPDSREVVLERLLRKRAAAFCAGLDEQEQLLRNQIIWSLPIAASTADGGSARAAGLREQAEHYRVLFAGSVDPGTAESLATMAEECEAEAERIEGECGCDAVLHEP
jgi:hypothetical protein